MPIYEFQCPYGHVTERLVPMGTEGLPCEQCGDKRITDPSPGEHGRLILARRILSATPTNFKFADRRANKG